MTHDDEVDSEDAITLWTRPTTAQFLESGPAPTHGLQRRRPRSAETALSTPPSGTPLPGVITPVRPDLVQARQEWVRRMSHQGVPSQPSGRRRATPPTPTLDHRREDGAEPGPGAGRPDDPGHPYHRDAPEGTAALGSPPGGATSTSTLTPTRRQLREGRPPEPPTFAGVDEGALRSVEPPNVEAVGVPGVERRTARSVMRGGVRYEWRHVSPAVPAVVAVVGLAVLVFVQASIQAPQIEHYLTDRSLQQLHAAGLSQVHVSFSGRDARLSGTVAAPGDGSQAQAVVESITGVGAVVDDTMLVPGAASTAGSPTPARSSTTG